MTIKDYTYEVTSVTLSNQQWQTIKMLANIGAEHFQLWVAKAKTTPELEGYKQVLADFELFKRALEE